MKISTLLVRCRSWNGPQATPGKRARRLGFVRLYLLFFPDGSWGPATPGIRDRRGGWVSCKVRCEPARLAASGSPRGGQRSQSDRDKRSVTIWPVSVRFSKRGRHWAERHPRARVALPPAGCLPRECRPGDELAGASRNQVSESHLPPKPASTVPGQGPRGPRKRHRAVVCSQNLVML